MTDHPHIITIPRHIACQVLVRVSLTNQPTSGSTGRIKMLQTQKCVVTNDIGLERITWRMPI